MFSSPLFRPIHARHPSAPVLARPSHTPGLLNITKPPQQVAPRPQPVQSQPRAPRASPKSKPQQRSPQPSHAQAAPVEKAKAPATFPAKVDQPSTTTDKPVRGRKQHKQPKDAGRRGTSVSPSDVAARRHAHQPSPPPARIPSPSKAPSAPRAQVARGKPEEPTCSTDPFSDDTRAPIEDTKREPKAFRSPPKLTSQPSGKLARRRQATTQLLDSPTPKVPSRRKARAQGETAALLQPAFTLRTQPPRRASVDMTLQQWDAFPICDDSSEFGDESDMTPPTTPIREASTAPSKTNGMWQQGKFIVDDAPHTAPLASTSGFPFAGNSPCSTPTPAQRRRNHRRVPSEGVFSMSADESSSSSVSDLFESLQLKRHSPVSIPRQRCSTVPAGTPSSFGASPSERLMSSSAPPAAGYFAGSVFQNSPSPDDLPAPSF
ncbi:hypothetical protein GSI_14535 [Ganoderma sinense ZZ0214-1]|uniref:Uncharacterized protein n=1 Tax=Ganoderma sinense ZZ0214-1 TaxID=1077348 RepID=A0A2G8RNZ7_9APHY|nr:hypothetical protein GSI_14535 [Ganoderma sinense ZZ0214-1]